MQPQARHTCRSLTPGRLARRQRARGGVAAIEFALVAPLMVVSCAGLYDLTTGFLAWQRLNLATLAIAQIATAMAAGSTVTNTLSLAQAQTASSAIYAYLPDTLSAAPSSFSVTLSSVVMLPAVPGCVSNCTYTAHVAWTGVYQGTPSPSLERPCDASGGSALNSVPDTASPSPGTLPADVYSVAPLLVVDVTYTFRPLFLTMFSGDVLMRRPVYFPARAGLTESWIQYSPGASDPTVQCPGYPWAAGGST